MPGVFEEEEENSVTGTEWANEIIGGAREVEEGRLCRAHYQDFNFLFRLSEITSSCSVISRAVTLTVLGFNRPL